MEIPQISTTCVEAQATHFRLELESVEVDGLNANVNGIIDVISEGNVRLNGREKILQLGIKFLGVTLEDCESCDYMGTKNEIQCPNISALGFIRDTLTK